MALPDLSQLTTRAKLAWAISYAARVLDAISPDGDHPSHEFLDIAWTVTSTSEPYEEWVPIKRLWTTENGEPRPLDEQRRVLDQLEQLIDDIACESAPRRPADFRRLTELADAHNVVPPELDAFRRASRGSGFGDPFAPCALEEGVKVEERLISDLASSTAATRRIAAGAIGNLKLSSDRIVSALLLAVSNTDRNVRVRALKALVSAIPHDMRAVEVVTAALQSPDVWQRIEAASSAAALPPDAIRDRLLAALDDPDRGVVGSAIRALRNSGHDTAAESALARLLRNSRNAEGRENVIATLRSIGARSEKTIAALQHALAETDRVTTRSDAADFLASLGVRPNMPIVDLLRFDGGIRALPLFGPDCIDGLIAALESTEPARIRAIAATELGRYGADTPRSRAALERAARSPVEEISLAVRMALAVV